MANKYNCNNFLEIFNKTLKSYNISAPETQT